MTRRRADVLGMRLGVVSQQALAIQQHTAIQSVDLELNRRPAMSALVVHGAGFPNRVAD